MRISHEITYIRCEFWVIQNVHIKWFGIFETFWLKILSRLMWEFK